MESVNVQELLKRLGIKKKNYGATTGSSKGWLKTTGKELDSISPIDGKVIATVIQATKKDYEKVAAKAKAAFEKFKMMAIAAHPEIHFVFHFQRVKDGKEAVDYVLDTDEVYEALDGVSLQEPEVMAYLKEMVEENIR